MDEKTTTATSVSCPKCGRRYAWRAEYEGRQLTCKCGGRITVARPAVAVAATSGGGTAGGGGRTATVASGYVVGHRARPQVAQDGGDGSVVREWVGPIGLLAVGVVGRGVELAAMRSPGHGPGVAVVTAFAVGGIVIGAVAVMIGALGAAQVMGSELDGVGALARKVCAIAAFAAFVGVLCASVDKDPWHFRGLIVALHVVMLIYFVGISYLLKLDVLEALMATVIAIAVQVGLFLAVAQALPGAMGRLMYYSG